MNCKTWFLTVLFASPLSYNKRGQAAAAAGQKSACGLRSHWSRVRPKNSNLIEKQVSLSAEKSPICNGFSPFSLHCSECVCACKDEAVAMLLLALQMLAEMKVMVVPLLASCCGMSLFVLFVFAWYGTIPPYHHTIILSKNNWHIFFRAKYTRL